MKAALSKLLSSLLIICFGLSVAATGLADAVFSPNAKKQFGAGIAYVDAVMAPSTRKPATSSSSPTTTRRRACCSRTSPTLRSCRVVHHSACSRASTRQGCRWFARLGRNQNEPSRVATDRGLAT